MFHFQIATTKTINQTRTGEVVEMPCEYVVYQLAELLCIPDDAVRAEGGRAGVGTEICYFMRV